MQASFDLGPWVTALLAVSATVLFAALSFGRFKQGFLSQATLVAAQILPLLDIRFASTWMGIVVWIVILPPLVLFVLNVHFFHKKALFYLSLAAVFLVWVFVHLQHGEMHPFFHLFRFPVYAIPYGLSITFPPLGCLVALVGFATTGMEVEQARARSSADGYVAMKCAKCGHLNDDDARFCQRCGGAMG
ncbi:MAG: zinc ribbon domain-containing protein [Deltaproteobacteria bacterium]|nr:zinc ribbon domain-containing protein [Deltaproteobacteria bacterium]